MSIWPIPARRTGLHNEPVTRFFPVFVLLTALPSLASDDPMAKGRALYDAARQAATGGQTLHDISYQRIALIRRAKDSVRVTSAITVVLPNTSRTEMVAGAAPTILVYDGKSVLNLSAGGAKLPPRVADLQRRELARVFVLFGPEPAESAVRYRGEDEVEGRPVDLIELFDVGDTALRLFLDHETHDVLKRMFVGDAPDGSMAQVEEFLSDYRTVGGFRWPHAIRTVRNGKSGPKSTISAVKVNQRLTGAEILK